MINSMSKTTVAAPRRPRMSSALAGLMGGVALMAIGGGASAQVELNTATTYLVDGGGFVVYGNLPGYTQTGTPAESLTIGANTYTQGMGAVAAGQIDEYHPVGIIEQKGAIGSTPFTPGGSETSGWDFSGAPLTLDSFCFDLYDGIQAYQDVTTAEHSALLPSVFTSQAIGDGHTSGAGPGISLNQGQINDIIGLAEIGLNISEDGSDPSESGLPQSAIPAIQAAIWSVEYPGISIDFAYPGSDTTDLLTGGGCGNGLSADCSETLPGWESEDLSYFEGLTFGNAALPTAYQSGVQDIAIAYSSIPLPVPEPADWVMLLIGTAFAGGFMRRRKVSARVKTSLAYAFAHAKRR